MTMVVDFADGFTSDETPNLLGLGNEIFEILNNKSSPTEIEGFDLTGYSSLSGILELERSSEVDGLFRQTMEIKMSRKADNSWSLTFGSYDGDDLIQPADGSYTPQQILLYPEGEKLLYISGNMDSYQYDGKLKLCLNRINS